MTAIGHYADGPIESDNNDGRGKLPALRTNRIDRDPAPDEHAIGDKTQRRNVDEAPALVDQVDELAIDVRIFSGSLIIVLLLLLYPRLKGSDLIGTDLVQAIPLVAAAALAHVFVLHDFKIAITSSILIGSVPGVYLGARLSSRAPDGIIRPALVFVLVASGLKLLGVPTETLGWVLLGFVLVGLPLWGAVDAASRPHHEWVSTGLSRRTWIGMQGAGALFGFGFAVACAYFGSTRRRLIANGGPPQLEPVPVAAP